MKPWGDKNDAYEDGYRRGYNDALEAAAALGDEYSKRPNRVEGVAASAYLAEQIRKLKPAEGKEVG